MTERWKAIPDFPGYEVSDCGRIRSFKKYGRGIQGKPHMMSAQTDGLGYQRISLYGESGRHTSYVHRLVALAFLGPCPDGLECCHNDGDASNNHVGNIRYDTHRSNQFDAIQQGSYSDIQKLTPTEVRRLRKLRKQGHSLTSLARRFGIASATVQSVVRRLTYSYID